MITREHIASYFQNVGIDLRLSKCKCTNFFDVLNRNAWSLNGFSVEITTILPCDYTCQLVSDYNNILPEDFTTTAKWYANYPTYPAENTQRGQDSDNEPKLQLDTLPTFPTASEKLITPAKTLISNLSFSHIVELLTADDPLVRFFYEMDF